LDASTRFRRGFPLPRIGHVLPAGRQVPLLIQ
jgi:hypothetical protein